MTSLAELAALFLRLGTTAFGGPAAHIAMMREEVVVRRAWLDDARFLDLVSATNLIPGPSSTELAIHIGHARRGLPGLVVAGACFIVPAALITVVVAVLWARGLGVPLLAAGLAGIKPVIVGIIAHALLGLLPRAAATWRLRGIAVVAGGAVALAGAHELVALLGAGLIALIASGAGRGVGASSTALFLPVPSWLMATGAATTAAATTVTAPTLWGLGATFSWIGSVLFGSGYVLVAFLRRELVERLGWLTESQLLDAVAIGQLTPGPVFTTATVIGWMLLGGAGAVVATVAIFLPAFAFVAASGPLIPRLRASRRASAFLDGVNAASLALIAVVAADLARAAVVSVVDVIVIVATGVILWRLRPNPSWLVVAGFVVGVAAGALR